MKYSQLKHSNNHGIQHLDYKRNSSKAMPRRRKQCTRILVAQTNILCFHPQESLGTQNNTFSNTIDMYNQ
jgi:hypothetical protein